MIPQEIVDQILNTAQIEEVVGEFVPLKKSGANYKANSPWTDERTPSFFVSPGKNIFKDFSSGRGGNPATFLMEHEQMSYPQALRWLAEMYNIEIPEKEETEEEKKERTEKDSLYIILNYAKDYYHHYLLNNEQGKAIGLSYFKERGFSEEIIRKFELGYAPSGKQNLVNDAIANQYQEIYLEKSGLAKRDNDNNLIDRFRDRVMFPIHSVSGKTLGFGGRTLTTNTKAPKYLNSPETEVYNKSQILYGIYQAKEGMRKKDECLMVEGYTDVLSLHQAGIDNVVASSGTSLTDDHFKLVKKFASSLVFMFDSDQAGVNASMKAIDLALSHQLKVKVIHLPEGEDPDTFAQQNDQTSIEEYLGNHARDFILYKVEQNKDVQQKDPLKRAETIRSIVHSISHIPDALNRNVYIQETSRLMDVSEELLYQELNKLIVDKVKKQNKRQKATATNTHTEVAEKVSGEQQKVTWGKSVKQEQEVIKCLLSFGSYDYNGEQTVAEYLLGELSEIEWESESCRKVLTIYQQYLENQQEHPPDEVFTQHDDQHVQQMAVDSLTQHYELSENWEEKIGKVVKGPEDNYTKDVKSALNHLKLKKILLLLKQNEEELKKASSDEKIDELMQVHTYLTNLKKEISDEIGTVILG